MNVPLTYNPDHVRRVSNACRFGEGRHGPRGGRGAGFGAAARIFRVGFGPIRFAPPRLSVKFPLLLAPLLLQAARALTPSADQSAWERVRIYTPLLAVLVPLVAYLTAQYKDWRSAQGTLNKAFQGDNDAVVYMTHKVQHNEWKRRMKRAPGFRREVITALCLAWSVQRLDYIKALLYDALLCVGQQGYADETQFVLDKLLRQYHQYHARFAAAEFTGVIESMEQLKVALAAGEQERRRKKQDA